MEGWGRVQLYKIDWLSRSCRRLDENKQTKGLSNSGTVAPRAYCEKLALKLSYRAAVQMKRGCLPAVFHSQGRGKKFHASAFSYIPTYRFELLPETKFIVKRSWIVGPTWFGGRLAPIFPIVEFQSCVLVSEKLVFRCS